MNMPLQIFVCYIILLLRSWLMVVKTIYWLGPVRISILPNSFFCKLLPYMCASFCSCDWFASCSCGWQFETIHAFTFYIVPYCVYISTSCCNVVFSCCYSCSETLRTNTTCGITDSSYILLIAFLIPSTVELGVVLNGVALSMISNAQLFKLLVNGCGTLA